MNLWDDFARALDASLDRDPTTRQPPAHRRGVARIRWKRRAVLYAIESTQPEISRTKQTGLVEHYGFSQESPGTGYFSLHTDRDHAQAHAEASKRVLTEQTRPEDADRLVAAAEAAPRGELAPPGRRRSPLQPSPNGVIRLSASRGLGSAMGVLEIFGSRLRDSVSGSR